jgi:hypothetical protein
MPLVVAALLAAGILTGARHPQTVFVGRPAQPVAEHVLTLPEPMRPAAAHAAGAALEFYGTFAADAIHATDTMGPRRAMTVHAIRARDLRREISRLRGISVGRTSDRLRDPSNAAPTWARRFVEDAAGKKGGEVAPVVVDLGDHVGVLVPMTTWGRCLACHDEPDRLERDVPPVLSARFPADRALGYTPGEHRGFVWAVAPK